MKKVIRCKIEDALREQEIGRPGITALWEKKCAEQPRRDPWAVLADVKVAYIERGERA